MKITECLRAYIETVPLADGHEHYCTFRQFRDAGGSFVALALLAYLCDDALALGAPPEHVYPTPTEEQAWSAYGPRLVAMRNTGYYRAASLACRRFYDCDLPATRENWMALSARIADRYRGEDWFHRTIRDAMNCRVVSWAPLGVDNPAAENPDSGLLRRNSQSLHTLHHGYPLDAGTRAAYAQRYGVADTLDALLAGYREFIRAERERGLASLKNSDAYGPGLDIRPVARAEAERLFAAGCRGEALSPADAMAWRNFFEFQRARVAAAAGGGDRLCAGRRRQRLDRVSGRRHEPPRHPRGSFPCRAGRGLRAAERAV